ncbi:putative Ig domain-containing protein, partial [candidate division KSB1 bacterium]
MKKRCTTMKPSMMLLAAVSCLSSDTVSKRVVKLAAGVSIILLFLSIMTLPAARPALGQDILTFVETEGGFATGGISEGDPIISDGFMNYGEPVEVEVSNLGIDSELGNILMWIDGRNLAPENVAQIDISTDQSFSAGSVIYPVINIEFRPGEGFEGRDEVEGVIDVIYADFLTGDYYVRVRTTTGDDVVHGPFYYEQEVFPLLSDVVITDMRFYHYDIGQTVVMLVGESFNAFRGATGATIQLSDVPFSNGNTIYTVEILEIDDWYGSPDYIYGMTAASADGFAAGDYYIRISAPGEPDYTLGPIPAPAGFIPTEPVLYPIGSLFDTDSEVPGVTDVVVLGDLLNTVTISSIDISSDPTFTVDVATVNDFSVIPDEEGALDIIAGTLNLNISEIPVGSYYVRLNTDAGPVLSEAYFFGGGDGGEPEMWDGDFYSDGTPNVTTVTIYGQNLPPLADITSVTVGSFTLTGLTEGWAPIDNMYIQGTVSVDIASISGTNFDVTINVQSGESFTFPQVEFNKLISDGTPQMIGGGMFSDGTAGMTQVIVGGIDLPPASDITGVTVDGIALSPFSIGPYPPYPTTVSIISGSIAADISSFTDGSVYTVVLITSMGDLTFQVEFDVEGEPGPSEPVEVYWFWMGSLSNTLDRMKIGVGGRFGPNDITAIEISMDQTFSGSSPIYDVTEIEVRAEAGGDNEDVANGFIEVGFNELEPGSYFARVTTLSGEELTVGPCGFTGVEFSGFGLSPQTGGIVRVDIRTRNVLSGEVTAAELSTDSEFTGASPVYTVTDLKFIPASDPRYRDTFRGIIHESFMNIPPGEYFLKVYSSAAIVGQVAGPQTIPSGTWPPLSDVVINDFGLLYHSVDTTGIVLKGDAFRAFRVYDAAVQISADPSFSGSVYDVILLDQHRQYYGPWLQYGKIPVGVTGFAGGEYYARVVTPGEPTLYSGAITIPADFIPDQPVLYSTIDDILRSSSTQGVTNFRMKGDLLDQVTVEQVEVSSDPGFNPGSVIYTVENVEKIIDSWGLIDRINGKIPVGIGDIPPGMYYVSVSITEGDPIISDGFQHYGETPPPVEVEVSHFGFWPSSGKVGVGVEGANLVPENVTGIFVSMDDQFGAGSTIYPVTELYFESDDGWQEVYGIIDVNYIDFPHGDYYVKVTSPSGDVVFGPVTFPTEQMPPPISSVTVSGLCLLHLGADMTLALIEGTNFEAFSLVSDFTVEISDNAAFTGVVYTVSVLDIDSDVGPIFMIGLIDASVISFPAGNYYVRITVPGEPEIMSGALALPEGFIPTQPVIYNFGSLLGENDEPGETRFCLFGDLLDLVTIAQVEVSQDPTFEAGSVIYVVESIEVEVDGMGAIDYLDGVINVDISDIPAGNYYVRLILAEGVPIISDAFTFGGVDGGEPSAEVFDFHFSPGFGNMRVCVEGMNLLPENVTSVEISSDESFPAGSVYQVSNLRFGRGVRIDSSHPEMFIIHEIKGIINETPLSLAGGMYYVRVSTSEGLKYGGSFNYEPPPSIPSLSSVTVSKIKFVHYGTDTTLVAFPGEEFEAFSVLNSMTVQVSDDNSFSAGQIYNVDVIDCITESGAPDMMLGRIFTSVDDILQGTYYVKFTASGETDLVTTGLPAAAGFVPTQPVLYDIGVIFHEFSGDQTLFALAGNLLDQGTITQVDISQDQTFTSGPVYTADHFRIATSMVDVNTELDLMGGMLEWNISEFQPGAYYFRLAIEGGDPIISDAFYYNMIAPVPEVNTIDFLRALADGNTTQFGSTINEGETKTLGGMPSPLNFLNGGKLTFPENSLSDDITITIKLPEFANTQGKDVTFGDNVVAAVTFEVSVDGQVVSPYVFDIPLELTLPFKKGLLNNLGIDPLDLGMFFVTAEGELLSGGITDVSIDSKGNKITANVAHFSDIAVGSEETFRIVATILPNAVEGEAYSCPLEVCGCDEGGEVTFELIDGPAWLSINTATGELSGTPGTNDVCSCIPVILSATLNGITSTTIETTINVSEKVIAQVGVEEAIVLNN